MPSRYRFYLTGFEPVPALDRAQRQRLIQGSRGLIVSEVPIPRGEVIETELGSMRVVEHEYGGKVIICEATSAALTRPAARR